MGIRELIVDEVKNIPEERLLEILDFMRLVETKSLTQGLGTAIASETALKKDWLTPREDEAWRNL